MNWLFCVVLLIILMCCVAGYKLGFLKMTFSAVSIIISIIITSMLTPVVTKSLRNNKNVYNYFYGIVSEAIDKDDESKKVVTGKQQADYIKNMSTTKSLKSSMLKDSGIDTYKEKGIEKFQDYLKDTFTNLIINIVSYFIVFIVVRLVIYILLRVLDVVGKLPVLEKVNKHVGAIVGLVQSLLIIWVLFAIIVIFSNASFAKSAHKCVKENTFLEILYDNNVLVNLGTMFFK